MRETHSDHGTVVKPDEAAFVVDVNGEIRISTTVTRDNSVLIPILPKANLWPNLVAY